MRVLVVLAGFLLVLGASDPVTAPIIHYRTTPAADVRPWSDCARYFHAACNNWRVAEWLPTLLDGFEPWRHGKATFVRFTDRFIYEGKIPNDGFSLRSQGYPIDGTLFVYGQAGPPSGEVVYDYAHAIAFYSQGCCSWRSTVLAGRIAEPPIRVVNRNLHGTRTARGIALGDTTAHVEAVYGKATIHPAPGRRDLLLLSYVHMMNKTCGQFQNFAFLRDRVVYIELLNGC